MFAPCGPEISPPPEFSGGVSERNVSRDQHFLEWGNVKRLMQELEDFYCMGECKKASLQGPEDFTGMGECKVTL
jgi:hypothetical protein